MTDTGDSVAYTDRCPFEYNNNVRGTCSAVIEKKMLTSAA